ncbi:MAG: ParB/RepB/Spo0J family partition protein, partial [Syntrophomonas sp.]
MVKGIRGLGRGLEALLSNDEETAYNINDIEMELIQARPDQPRQSFDEDSLRELSESIKQHGVLQPILLRPLGGVYQIVAGERRWRAARLAELNTIPAVVKEMPDAQAAEISLVENLQRKDLNAVEEARALHKLSEEFEYTQEQLSTRIGKSRSHIANTMRLLNLPHKVLDMVEKGLISAGHARALVGLSQTEQYRMADQIAGKGLSVRDIENRVRKTRQKPGRPEQVKVEFIEMEERVQKHLSTRARIKAKK